MTTDDPNQEPIMPPAAPSDRTLKNFRLPSATVRQLATISERNHGLSETKIVEWAIDRLHAAVVKPTAGRPSRRKPS